MSLRENLNVPIAALRSSSQIILSTMLNSIKVIPTATGLTRDWRGLAELAGISSELMSYLYTKSDPTGEIIQQSCKSSDSRCVCFSDLRAFLAVIDRYDILDDVNPSLEKDAQAYKEATQGRVNQISQPCLPPTLDPSFESNILTKEDSERVHKGLQLTIYDAFLLFAEEDSSFAEQVVNKLEGDHGHKLCLKDRDLLPGIMFVNEVIGRLIEERCNRFIVIFSPSFLKSTANQFLVSYAQASALDSRVRKIVPCIYEPCELPPSVRYLFSIKYNRSGNFYNFWEKLSQSLRPTPNFAKTAIMPAVNELEKIPSTITDKTVESWVPNKVSQDMNRSSPPPSYSQTMCKDEHIDINLNSSRVHASSDKKNKKMQDNMSLNSDTHSTGESKKWYKKLNPIGKKKDKKKDKKQLFAE